MSRPIGRTATRARILVGAASVFEERGLRGVTVKDIMEGASVSRRTFYQYFPGIDGLLDALYAKQIERLERSVGMALAKPVEKPAHRLRNGVDAYIAFQGEGGRLGILLQAEAVRPDSPLAPRRAQAIERLIGLVDGAMLALFDLQIDPLVYRGALVGIEGLALHVQQDGPVTDTERDRLHAAITKLLEGVLRPPPDALAP